MPHVQSSSPVALVMADVDGTLITPDKILTACARDAVFRLRAAGIKFTIISSRPTYGLNELARELRIDQPMVAFNGGLLISPDGEALQDYRLPSELIPDILDCLRHYGLFIRLFTADAWLISSMDDPYLQHEMDTTHAQPSLVPDFHPYFAQSFKITGVSSDVSAVARCEQAMQTMFHGRASAACSQPYYLDITDRSANKGHGVKMIAEVVGISEKNIAVIGDMSNDVPMFKTAGFSIAMGNADDSVKAQADAVTESNTDDGFAKAMERVILKQPSTAR